METTMRRTREGSRLVALLCALIAMAASLPARATSYISAEPIPSVQIAGVDGLAKIESAGLDALGNWSTDLAGCGMVTNTIDALKAYGAIGANVIYSGASPTVVIAVAAGGYQGVTDPSYLLTIDDSVVSPGDVAKISNALGYVLNQGGTAHFNLDSPNYYQSQLDYAVITFPNQALSLDGARDFFQFVGTLDAALYSGNFAGFTQVGLPGSSVDNSMVFLIPAVKPSEFVAGLSTAASQYPGASYGTLDNQGQPTTRKASVGFPSNDWAGFPDGSQYLAALGKNPSPALLSRLAALRVQHLNAVCDLLGAIGPDGTIPPGYLNPNRFSCPAATSRPICSLPN
jgi:hypothetical protein